MEFDALAAPYFTALLALDTYASVNLDTLAPVFALGPYFPDKPEDLCPVLPLGLDLTAFNSHISVPVPLPWGLTPDPIRPDHHRPHHPWLRPVCTLHP